ncbi:MAG: 4-hydroxythreonine-4-phosphate dehydrogenase PdxA [Deltaproteobacteria bacterium]|nr:4-hydroxythreonine-4-phosphate dehydrogenase PdxA [Deltaproteobacteria bacterium]
MGCPAGIGPEIILRHFEQTPENSAVRAVVLGDTAVLKRCRKELGSRMDITPWMPGTSLPANSIPVIEISSLPENSFNWGEPNHSTADAMAAYIQKGVEFIKKGWLDGITTCPISKEALNDAGYEFPGHTEMLAHLTASENFAMMMSGSRLKVTLVTIHCPLSEVPAMMSIPRILRLIQITHRALKIDFAIDKPRIAVAGLNPHGGENQLFGSEEIHAISPAVSRSQSNGIDVSGPYPPDTVFFKAARGDFDAVVCMYHDQGLIPFKLLHFNDGVNVTLGLPIVRTSVDHGTAYDIAGKGVASPESLSEAVKLAVEICRNRQNNF